ncbi:MAG: Ig-like domain-containing protein, partial [Oscillospiraceae bacterium]
VTPSSAVAWSSSDPAIATVDANGLVTGVAAGSATITAAANGKTATCAVTVTPKP